MGRKKLDDYLCMKNWLQSHKFDKFLDDHVFDCFCPSTLFPQQTEEKVITYLFFTHPSHLVILKLLHYFNQFSPFIGTTPQKHLHKM